MTCRDDIIAMARDAGLIRSGDGWTEPARWGATEIERFAALVAAAEREAWLEKLNRADWRPSSIFRHYYPSANGDWVNLRELKDAIHARAAGEQP